jgi:hypothetical protein
MYPFFSVFIALLVAWITFATLYEHYQQEYDVTGIFLKSAFVGEK